MRVSFIGSEMKMVAIVHNNTVAILWWHCRHDVFLVRGFTNVKQIIGKIIFATSPDDYMLTIGFAESSGEALVNWS